MARLVPALLLAMFLWASADALAAPGAFCRLDVTPWLGCPTAGDQGSPCACPQAGGGAAGRVRAPSREQVVAIASDSAKLATGLDQFTGPVVVFVPLDLIARRDTAVTPEQQRLLQIYDLTQYRNAAPVSPKSEAGRPAAARHSPNPATTPELYPVRAFIAGADIPPPGLGAYGIVALKAKPTPATQARLEMMCRSFLASLPPQSSLPATVPLSSQMVTFWPMAASTASSDCPTLLTGYDLWAGISAVHDATAQGRDLSGRGPFLIGWSPSDSRQVPDAVVLVVDMSNFEEQASFDDAFLFWQRKVVEDPTLWRSGFSVTRLRLAMRDFADHYGTDILKAVHLGGE